MEAPVSNTQVNKEEVDGQAEAHLQLADEVKRKLDQTVEQVISTAQISGSRMTEELVKAAHTWRDNVHKEVLTGMHEMSNSMKVAAGQQVDEDEANAQQITGLPL